LGVDPGTLARGARMYAGIARRFDRILTKRGITVIDDYAHNPDKVRAALAAARRLAPRLHALFQPHGFAPARFMLEDLSTAFNDMLREGDTLYVLPIYYAGGTTRKDISSRDIARRLQRCAADVRAPADRDEAVEDVARRAEAGDAVISMGARDPSLPEFAARIAAAIDRAP
ncbi:MAG: UDP-N-acetylmuramate--alanine ligase, partial [Chitinivibrionales bacterium]|nr:UDP-N-acetylmuramate--alanine ligase [Chitinivibrionales bacterium]MBD3396400.1 UDP-N-acetylmuramate--alanine ligase [Chitinivibrionales bacterium]